MFDFNKAYPFIDGQTISDPRSDRRSAKKIGDTKYGHEAIFFYKDGTPYYIPYSAVTSAKALIMPEHHSCCSGGSTIDVPTVMVHCIPATEKGQPDIQRNVKLSYTNTESSQEAERIINSRLG